MTSDTNNYTEKRRYIRLNSCFPVEFSLIFTTEQEISEIYQGFTCNISKGGICLLAPNLKPQDKELILQRKVRLKLLIHIPLGKKAVSAIGDIAWARKNEEDSAADYLIGISYVNIDEKDASRIINYARQLKWAPRALAILIIVLFAGIFALLSIQAQAKRQNLLLVDKLVSMSEAKGSIEKDLNEINVRKDMLQRQIFSGRQEIERLSERMEFLETRLALERKRLQKEIEKASSKKAKDRIDVLNVELAEINRRAGIEAGELKDKIKKLEIENSVLKQGISKIGQNESLLEARLFRIKAERKNIEGANIEKMIDWIKIHRNKKTGLVLSYEGDKDIEGWGFTYDEALCAQVFLMSGYKDEARAILKFYNEKAARSGGLFYNAYDIYTGEPCEDATHSGPNIWIAISVCQYVHNTKNRQFLALAEQIADKMIQLQAVSSDGSIKGAPGVKWVSTEHNLDAYALFNMLYKITGREKYNVAALTALDWLKNVGYNKPEQRFMRGKGDATIATDTFSWAIAAIGPDVLKAKGMNPDAIIEFAEKECKVTAQFYRPDGKDIEVTGFDFAKAQNIGRGGIISTEWTAQMIVSLYLMADYYQPQDAAKADNYRKKAEFYLSQLGKMAIASPSPTGQGEGCLPYASIDNVDTGHGWRVAKGKSTGSVSATAYYIFASKRYNPLML